MEQRGGINIYKKARCLFLQENNKMGGGGGRGGGRETCKLGGLGTPRPPCGYAPGVCVCLHPAVSGWDSVT